MQEVKKIKTVLLASHKSSPILGTGETTRTWYSDVFDISDYNSWGLMYGAASVSGTPTLAIRVETGDSFGNWYDMTYSPTNMTSTNYQFTLLYTQTSVAMKRIRYKFTLTGTETQGYTDLQVSTLLKTSGS